MFPLTLSRDAFVDLFGGVYEHSAWIACSAFDRGLDACCARAQGLADAMAAIVAGADPARQDALIAAHPDLAGRLALPSLTASSQSEQAGAGLDRLTGAERATFLRLNAAYKARFGFPFIIAVKGLGKADILHAFETRLKHEPAAERAEALRQIDRIAALRIAAIFAKPTDSISSP